MESQTEYSPDHVGPVDLLVAGWVEETLIVQVVLHGILLLELGRECDELNVTSWTRQAVSQSLNKPLRDVVFAGLAFPAYHNQAVRFEAWFDVLSCLFAIFFFQLWLLFDWSSNI